MDRFIRILLWGTEIGSLMWKNNIGEAYFMYKPEFLDDFIEPFPLAAKKSSDKFLIYRSTDGRKFQHLPSFIADSLPDMWGDELFDYWVANQTHISRRDITPLDKLSFIGKRGMGALEFVPDIPEMVAKEQIDVAALAKLANKIFEQREQVVILPDESITMQTLLMVGTSAGGRQPKAILAIHPDTQSIRSGQIAEQDGYQFFILKFGNKERSTSELEMTYYQLTRLAGIQMMPSKLWLVDGVNHFLTERFDRKDGQKLHSQTLAAMRPEAESYEDLMLVCRELRLPDGACDEIFRRMVFNYLANNTDDHDKNFSFIMNQNGVWSLAPAYDMTFVFNSAVQPEHNHCLRMRGLRCDWTKDDVLAFAKDNGINGAERIIHEVAEALTHFRELAQQNGVGQPWINCVETTINHHLTEWGCISPAPTGWATATGQTISNAYLTMAKPEVIKLCAVINGKERHTFITKTKPEYALAMQYGFAQLPLPLLRAWVEKYLLSPQ